MSELTTITQVDPLIFWAVQFYAWVGMALLAILCFGFAAWSTAWLFNRAMFWWLDHWCFIRVFACYKYGNFHIRDRETLAGWCNSEYQRMQSECLNNAKEASDE